MANARTVADQDATSTPLVKSGPFAALMLGNLALALGPWSVRLADCGPVSSAFWRLALALPLLALFARRAGQPLGGLTRKGWLAVAAAGVLFALDLASWHLGIERTRLGNATLFGNSGSVILMVWGLIALHRRPRKGEWAALAFALGGAAILLGRSVEIGTRTLTGDLFCILAGFLYTFYILLLQSARVRTGHWTLLFHATLAGTLVLLAIGILRGEPVIPQGHWPHAWWPLVVLALGSQVIGQGLVVYALRHFSTLFIGLALLSQPAVAVLVGWFVFHESLVPIDLLGMVLVGAGLVLARGSSGSETVAAD
ncbi:DMT family transporter [Novosphingobium sp.]|uniref:DMT family transporter n=1 Tax=Novosphingobium sp. TaxID=1874826 RepID=UPI0025F62E30|nr:DMT family transporter [Novosphingobium sp.]